MKEFKSYYSFSRMRKRHSRLLALTLGCLLIAVNISSATANTISDADTKTSVNQQNRTITVTGFVTDNYGDPLPGATAMSLS